MGLKKLRRIETNFGNKKYLIEEELFYPPGEETLVWAYLYVYENNLCTEDHLQDNVEMCMKYALDICQVPLEDWVELPSVFEEEKRASVNENACLIEYRHPEESQHAKDDMPNTDELLKKIENKIQGLTAEEIVELRDYLIEKHVKK